MVGIELERLRVEHEAKPRVIARSGRRGSRRPWPCRTGSGDPFGKSVADELREIGLVPYEHDALAAARRQRGDKAAAAGTSRRELAPHLDAALALARAS